MERLSKISLAVVKDKYMRGIKWSLQACEQCVYFCKQFEHVSTRHVIFATNVCKGQILWVSRRVCIQRKYKWQVAYSTVSHEKALHNYFIPCLNLQKINGNFQKLRKCFKPIFTVLRNFHKKDFWKFWKIFGNLWELLENFRNSSKVFSNVLMIF